MNYLPNLIPERSKLPKELEKMVIHQDAGHQRTASQIFSYLASAIFFCAGLVHLFSRFWQAFFFILVALAFWPPIHYRLEEALRFRFNWRIKGVLVALLWSTALLLGTQYEKKEIAEQAALEQEKLRLEKEAALEKQRAEAREQFRTSQLKEHKRQVFLHAQEKNEEAFRHLDSALRYCAGDSIPLVHLRGKLLMEFGSYEDALAVLTHLIPTAFHTDSILYDRALCHEKLGLRKEAVVDLLKAANRGHEKAGALYEKLNPVKRRISHYVTRCCDGSISSARGQGACSHHDGVCNWNEAVYENYREY